MSVGVFVFFLHYIDFYESDFYVLKTQQVSAAIVWLKGYSILTSRRSSELCSTPRL